MGEGGGQHQGWIRRDFFFCFNPIIQLIADLFNLSTIQPFVISGFFNVFCDLVGGEGCGCFNKFVTGHGCVPLGFFSKISGEGIEA